MAHRQPIGVGLSFTDDRSLWADDLLDAGIDFDKFLDGFFDIFPDLKSRPLHFAGESFGGQYVPVYTAMAKRHYASIILVDPWINFAKAILGIYHHFCVYDSEETSTRPSKHLNETSCAEMEAHYTTCEKFGRQCEMSYDATICKDAYEKCAPIQEVFWREVVPGGRNPYDDRVTCTEPPLCGRLGKLSSIYALASH
jgi:cathepsin A (carboxypeptidase C)